MVPGCLAADRHDRKPATKVKPRIIYITDPLCGWCYAFGFTLKEVIAQFPGQFEFSVVLGGMVTGEREGPIGAKAEYILKAIPRLERITGITMSEAHKTMLREGTQWQSSVMPSKAVVAFRELMPERSIDFLHEVQIAHFQGGTDLNDGSIYTPIATRLGVDADLFDAALHHEKINELTKDDFTLTANWGISGFPALAAEVGTRFYGLANGYRDKEDLAKLFEAVLKVDPTSA